MLYEYKPQSDSIVYNEIILVTRIILYYLIPAVLVIQLLVSFFYYFMFRASLTESKFKKLFLINLSYVVLPLLPISFTYFWKFTTLHGTVCFLKTLKALKKILLNSNLPSNEDATEKSKSSKNRRLASDALLHPNPTQSSFKVNNLERSQYDETAKMLSQSEANLNQDDLSQINDLSSIDSLLAAMPKKKINNESYWAKLSYNLKFYFKIISIVLFNRVSPDKILNDSDIQNASFIYFTNFLVGLGIITVIKYLLNVWLN